nr:Cyclin domain containing protein [Haemonchus contortus]
MNRFSAASGCGCLAHGDSMEDGDSSTNTLLVSLRERESVFYAVGRLPARLPQGDGVIGWPCRDREAAWICSAARRLGLDVDSFTLAVALLDRVICGTRVPTKYVNCVAAACLSLAKKLCEDHEEDASLYLQRLRLSYSARELKRMELRILDLLGWDAHLPSFDRFLVALLKSMGGEWLVSPLRVHVEAIVCDSSVMSQFAPSTLALAVVSLLVEATSKQWMPAIQTQIKLCKTDPCELLRCRERLSSIWSRTLCNDDVVSWTIVGRHRESWRQHDYYQFCDRSDHLTLCTATHTMLMCYFHRLGSDGVNRFHAVMPSVKCREIMISCQMC